MSLRISGCINCDTQSECEIKESNFAGSRSVHSGGAISCDSQGQMKIFSSKFSNITAGVGGDTKPSY